MEHQLLGTLIIICKVHKSQSPEHDDEYTKYAKRIYCSCVSLIKKRG